MIGARSTNVLRCILGINFHPFDCLMTNNFLCLLSLTESSRDIFVIRCPGEKKDLEHTIWQLLREGEIASFVGWTNFPPPPRNLQFPMMPGITLWELMRSPDTYSLLVRGAEERSEGTVREVKGIPPPKVKVSRINTVLRYGTTREGGKKWRKIRSNHQGVIDFCDECRRNIPHHSGAGARYTSVTAY